MQVYTSVELQGEASVEMRLESQRQVLGAVTPGERRNLPRGNRWRRKIVKNTEAVVSGKEQPLKEAEEGGQRSGRETTQEDARTPASRTSQKGGHSHKPKSLGKSGQMIGPWVLPGL